MLTSHQRELFDKLVEDTQEKLTPSAKLGAKLPSGAVLLWNLTKGSYKYSFKDFEAIYKHISQWEADFSG